MNEKFKDVGIQKKTIYTIGRKFYDSYSIETCLDREEWETAIDNEASSGRGRGTDGTFEVGIYEAPEVSEIQNWTGIVWHPAARDRHASVDSTPEDWEEVGTQKVSYWHPQEIFAERSEDGYLTFLVDADDEDEPEAENGGVVVPAWMGEGGIYETEEEMYESENPSQYLYI